VAESGIRATGKASRSRKPSRASLRPANVATLAHTGLLRRHGHRLRAACKNVCRCEENQQAPEADTSPHALGLLEELFDPNGADEGEEGQHQGRKDGNERDD
jgi:hypothetical protein